MSRYSRRHILRALGAASAAGALSFTMPGCKKGSQQASPKVVTPNDLYLIFPGSWLFCFENGRINALTTNFDDHTYDFGMSLPSGQPRATIEVDQTYTVDVSGYTPASSSQALFTDMKSASQGLLFTGVTRNQGATSGLRTISLPMPSEIHPAALIKGVAIGIDPSITQIPSIVQWPAALALIYSGWTFATVTSSDQGQSTVRLSPGQPTHLSFRTCLKSRCDTPLGCVLDCKQIAADIDHAQKVFKSMMDLLVFPTGKPSPTLTFPPCTPGTGGMGGTFDVSIDPGKDPDIQKSEIGMPVECIQFGSLHNCAAGVGIVGA